MIQYFTIWRHKNFFNADPALVREVIEVHEVDGSTATVTGIGRGGPHDGQRLCAVSTLETEGRYTTLEEAQGAI
jgi:hypothetical protein